LDSSGALSTPKVNPLIDGLALIFVTIFTDSLGVQPAWTVNCLFISFFGSGFIPIVNSDLSWVSHLVSLVASVDEIIDFSLTGFVDFSVLLEVNPLEVAGLRFEGVSFGSGSLPLSVLIVTIDILSESDSIEA